MDLRHRGIKIVDLEVRGQRRGGEMRWQVELKGRQMRFPSSGAAKGAIDRVLETEGKAAAEQPS